MTALITVFMPVSGAHFNPAISIASALIQRITPVRAMSHVVAQCGGSIAASSAVFSFFGASRSLLPEVDLSNLGLEFLLTLLIVLVHLRVVDDSETEK